MPKCVAVVSDDFILREVGHLADEVLLLPAQVQLLTGLSIGQLKERMRMSPPKPPHAEPRERKRAAVGIDGNHGLRIRGRLSAVSAVAPLRSAVISSADAPPSYDGVPDDLCVGGRLDRQGSRVSSRVTLHSHRY